MSSFARFASVALIAASLAACGGGDVEVDVESEQDSSAASADGGANSPGAGDVATAPGGTRDSAPRAPQAPMERPEVSTDEQAKIETWLTFFADSLNDYGDPEGTMYAGGTPLFDEVKGDPVSKYEYIAAKHPEKPWNQPLPKERPKKPVEKKPAKKDTADKD